jgi:hypothetical protein
MTTPTTVPVRLRLRADTAANWTSVNPILLANELGRETDTGKIKIGNGTSTWTSLAYQAWATLPVAVNAGGTGQTSYTNGQLLIGNTTGNTLTKATLTAGSGVAITNGTGSITVAASGIANANIAANAAIVDTKLATITTAGKVNNSATTADSANTANAIVARDASGNFSAGTITADLAGNASTVTTNADLTGDVTSVGNATSIAAGVIVDADVNASAAIAGTKISPNFGSQNIVTTGDVSAQDAVFSGDAQAASINGGPLAGMRNGIINGNFDIWQRGTSFTDGGYGADRWVNSRGGSACTMSRQEFALGQTDVPGEPTYFVRMAVTSVAGAGNTSGLQQRIEGVRTFADQQITVSFYAKADSTKNIAIEFRQIFGTGGSPSANVDAIGTVKKSLTTSWQKITHTLTMPSISGKTLGTDGDDRLIFTVFFDAGSNFNARTDSLGQQSGTFDIAQVQVEAGPVATPFERRPIGTELALCQRYYYKIDGGTNDCVAVGHNISTTQLTGTTFFPVAMRAAPGALEQSGTATDYACRNVTATTCSAVPTFVVVTKYNAVSLFTVASGLTAGQGGFARITNSNGYLAWSAEL